MSSRITSCIGIALLAVVGRAGTARAQAAKPLNHLGRFVMVQQYVAKLAMTAVDHPPM